MEDEYIHTINEALEGLNKSRIPGAFWLEFAPILKHVPAWFPGATGRRLGERYRPVVEKMKSKLFDVVRYGNVRMHMLNTSDTIDITLNEASG